MTGAAGMKQTVRLEGGVVRSEAIFHPSTALISKNNGAERGRPGGRRPGAECGEAGARESVGLEANPKLLFSFHPFAFSSTGKAAETGNRYCGILTLWWVGSLGCGLELLGKLRPGCRRQQATSRQSSSRSSKNANKRQGISIQSTLHTTSSTSKDSERHLGPQAPNVRSRP